MRCRSLRVSGCRRHYGWLTPTQMIDGLALGETTPGPLIMVVTFVGFCRWLRQVGFGPDSLFGRCRGRYAGDLVHVSAVLHLYPDGRPFIETTHNDLKFTAPLTATWLRWSVSS